MFNYGIHYNFVGMLFFLVVAHAYFDFPGQGEFLSQAKNPSNPLKIETGAWKWALFYHSIIHGGAVAIFTHSLVLGVAETILHAGVDYMKCRKTITLNQDQTIHIACKVLWAYLATAGLS